jgi:hypothetical protein
VHWDAVGQDTPTLPAAEVALSEDICQVPCWSTPVSPVASTNAQSPGDGHDSAAEDAVPVVPEAIGAGGLQSVPLPVLACRVASAITQPGPDVHEIAGTTGALTGPVVGAGKYTEGADQTAPSHDSLTPDPVANSEGMPLVPPPAAMQKVFERQDSEVKPPPGGTVLRFSVHPVVGLTGVGTVVGMADGVEVGTEDGVVVLGVPCRGGAGRWVTYLAAACEEQPQAIKAGTTNQAQPTLRRLATCVASRIPSLVPPQTGASRVRKTMPVRGLGWK